MASYLGSFKAVYEEMETESAEGTDTDRQPNSPSYIHLANTHFYRAGGRFTPVNRGVWWRGRLAAVDGFTGGQLSTQLEP